VSGGHRSKTVKDGKMLQLGVDEEICSKVLLRPIHEIGEDLGLSEEELIPYGHHKAKMKVDHSESIPRKAKLVLVTAMSPTKAGEGKTTTTVGVTDGMNQILRAEALVNGSGTGKQAAAVLREPSLGPVFGMKGGGAGGGHAQVAPMDEINLHFTGDFHAIGAAHNLLSALVDNHVHFEKEPKLDIRRVDWKRVVDQNDRALRRITCGLGGVANGYPREDGFDITVASEVMAILCLSKDLEDLERRLGNIIVGYTRNPVTPVRARDLQANCAMTALLKDAMLPNLVQTLEHSPAILHGGPFANIAHGCNSLVATDLGMKLADYVVTEAGFGADLGAEKFLNIKCRVGGLRPDLVMMVVSCRACKLHGGGDPAKLNEENLEQIRIGLENVRRHCENLGKFKLPVMVCINKFPTDTQEEERLVMEECRKFPNVVDCVVSDHWAKGGQGALHLARATLKFLNNAGESQYEPLYPLEWPLQRKIETVAKEIYRAKEVTFSKEARSNLKKFQKEYGHFPVCIAKTQYSFSDNPSLMNAPEGHSLHVTELKLSAGAEFVVVQCGDIMTMPGLPKEPSAQNIGITADGRISIEGKWVDPVILSPAAMDSPSDGYGPAVKVDHNDPKVISGTRISKKVREEIKEEVESSGLKPGLGVIMVGNKPDSATYVMAKTKLAKECGFHVKDILLPETATQDQVIEAVQKMNADSKIHGILTQLPMPPHINEQAVLNTLNVKKDVDGFSGRNVGETALKGGKPYAVSCTPSGVMEMLKREGVEISGKKCVVLGRSNIVGMPLTLLLHHADGTATMGHSKTQNLRELCLEADILCVAVGKPHFVPGHWIKKGAVVVDVGINMVEYRTSSGELKSRIVGDVDYKAAYDRASKITPVPGGVGPMTIAMLLKNTLELCKMHKHDKAERKKMKKAP